MFVADAQTFDLRGLINITPSLDHKPDCHHAAGVFEA